MLTPTHFAVVVLVAMLLSLNRDEWFIVLTFGVVIDADHLFALPRYVDDNGWSAVLRQTWDDASGLPWKSWFHYPMAAIVVGYLSLGWRLALPLVFWALHVGMDELQLALSGLNTLVESALLLGSVAGIVFLAYSRWSFLTGRSGLWAYAVSVVSSSRAVLAGLRGII
jgi:hypothetical protein